MKKKLKYFTDEAILRFKADRENFCDQMKSHPDNPDWIDAYFGGKASVASKYEFDFEFKDFEKNNNIEDFDNAVALYELFEENDLGPATIYNEKFLTGFIFTYGYQYFMKVIGADKTSHVFGTLFFDDGVRRAIARNTIGRLYRYVELTIDNTSLDRYELTRFAFQNNTLFRIRYYLYFDGVRTRMAYFKAFKKWSDETHKPILQNMVNKVMSHISVLCNVSDTDLMGEEELIYYIYSYIKDIEHGIV